MAESTLSLDYDNLAVRVAEYLGYSRTSGDWSVAEAARIDEIVQDGYRQFLMAGGHQWSFLEPTATLVTVADTADYDMPDDFGQLAAGFTFAANEAFIRVRVVPESRIRFWRQTDIGTSAPYYVAIRPKTTTGTTGQRFEALLHPTPGAVYNLTYSYRVLVNKLVTTEYPYGAMNHADALLKSCLAVAELRDTDEQGPHAAQYADALAVSIRFDGQSQPHHLGYNGDGSDRAVLAPTRQYATYDGSHAYD